MKTPRFALVNYGIYYCNKCADCFKKQITPLELVFADITNESLKEDQTLFLLLGGNDNLRSYLEEF